MKWHSIWKERCDTWRQRDRRSWRQQLLAQRQRVCMGFWGEQYHTPSYPHLPSSTISHLPPQEPMEPEASVPTEKALESTSSTAPSVERERFLPTCNPFVFSWGHQACIPMSGWRLQGGPINLPSHNLCTHVKGTPGSGAGVPPLQQVLFQSWRLQAPQKGSLKYVNRGSCIWEFCQ